MHKHGIYGLRVVACLAAFVFSAPTGFPGQAQGQPALRKTGATSLATGPKDQALQQYKKLPVRFEANKGQLPRDVKFSARGLGYGLHLKGNEALYRFLTPQGIRSSARSRADFRQGSLRVRFPGSLSSPKIDGTHRLGGFANYFPSADKATWRTGVPHFRTVTYRGLYPGVDLIYRSTGEGSLEYDFVVSPGGDPKQIALSFEGGRSVQINSRGDLIVSTVSGTLRHKRPHLYQVEEGRTKAVAGGFILSKAGSVRFWVGPYDRTRPLTIDPILEYSHYLGDGEAGQSTGAGDTDYPFDIAVDGSGAAYVTGFANDFFRTTTNSFQPAPAGPTDPDGSVPFMTKFDPSGAVIYSTYLGGSVGEAPDGRMSGYGIALDSHQNAYITGVASSSATTTFPTTPSAFKSVCGVRDAFVAKINPEIAGPESLIFSTCLLGDRGQPRPEPSTSPNPSLDTVTPIADGQSLDVISGANIGDSAGIYFFGKICPRLSSGLCRSMDAGTLGLGDPPGFRSGFQGGRADFFLAKLKLDGTGPLEYFSFIGSEGDDAPIGIKARDASLDATPAGVVFLTGYTDSASFPRTPGSRQFSGGLDGFVMGVDTKKDGDDSLVWSTLVGGPATDATTSIVSSGSGSVFVAGQTTSTGLEVPKGVGQRGYAGNGDAFVARYDPVTPGSLEYSGEPNYFAYLGGNGIDQARSVEFTRNRERPKEILVGGETRSADFPLLRPIEQDVMGSSGAFSFKGGVRGGISDGFLAKLDTSLSFDRGLRYSTLLGGSGRDEIEALSADPDGNIYVAGATQSDDFPLYASQTRKGRLLDVFVSKIVPALPEPAISPAFGPKAGGTPVVISGSLLKGTESETRVFFGDNEVPFTTDPSNKDNRLLVASPPFAGNLVEHVRVLTWEGISIDAPKNLFTYQDPPRWIPTDQEGPLVVAVIPPSGDKSGGTPVSVTGTNFSEATHVTFGPTTIPASAFSAAFDTEIRLTAPPHLIAEPVPVTVVTPTGASNPGAFTYTEVTPLPPASPQKPDATSDIQTGGLQLNQRAILGNPPPGGGISTPNLVPLAVTVPGPASGAQTAGSAASTSSNHLQVFGAQNDVLNVTVSPGDQQEGSGAAHHAMVKIAPRVWQNLWIAGPTLALWCSIMLASTAIEQAPGRKYRLGFARAFN